MSNCSKQVENLEEAIDGMPLNEPMKLVWERLMLLLMEMCTSIEGTNQNMGGMKSDMRFIMTLLMIYTGYEHDSEGALQRLLSSRELTDDMRRKITMVRNNPRKAELAQDVKKQPMPDWARLLIVGVIGGILSTVGSWLFVDIFPRIFTIPHP